MSESLRHRGPDGQGVWVSPDGRTGLVHRRLAIIDLSPAADQPMRTPDGRFIINYNGEIYNHLELRRHLEKHGVLFRTHCDTEVLLRHLELYGEAALNDLDGMFAFALWDTAERTLFCARDRFGEKPFFYHQSAGGQFVFASEIKALFAYGVEREANAALLYRFFRSRDDPFERAHPEQTFYSHVKKLESAGCLRVRDGKIVGHRRYWQVNADHQQRETTLAAAEERFRELFFRSVERRLHADVDVGSSLSGGLDSSSIVCTIDHLPGHPRGRQHTFSARFEGFELDEGRYIEAVGKKVGAHAHYAWPDADGFADELVKLFHYQDEPFGSSSIYAQFCVMRLAKDAGVVVLLDGQGADEILTGYHHYFDEYLAELAVRDPARHRLERSAFTERHSRSPQPVSPVVTRPRPWLGTLRRALRPAYVRSGIHHLRPARTLLTREFVHEATAHAPDPTVQPGLRSLNQSLRDDLIDGKLEILLRYADRNSMAHSREVRLPFLNHELVEFAFSLPGHYKIHDGWSKYLLRRSMESLLPAEVAWRTDKVGFATPERAWLSSSHFRDLRDAGKARLVQDGVVNAKWADDGSKDWELALAGLLP